MDLSPLRNRLCEELSHFTNRDLNASSLDTIDKLAHSIKCIDKIMSPDYDREWKKRESKSEVINHLYKMMEETPDEDTKNEIRRAIAEMEK